MFYLNWILFVNKKPLFQQAAFGIFGYVHWFQVITILCFLGHFEITSFLIILMRAFIKIKV